MKGTFLLLAALLTVTNAWSAPVKRQTSEHVVDGSFEDVPARDESKTGITTGGWTLKATAQVDDNAPFEPVFQTPYGKKFLAIGRYRKRGGSRGSISQPISGLTTGGSYKLSYAYQPYANDYACPVTVKLGSQTIDSFTIPAQGDGITDHYISRTKTFTAAEDSGTLMFTVVCPGSVYASVNLDNISLTGP